MRSKNDDSQAAMIAKSTVLSSTRSRIIQIMTWRNQTVPTTLQTKAALHKAISQVFFKFHIFSKFRSVSCSNMNKLNSAINPGSKQLALPSVQATFRVSFINKNSGISRINNRRKRQWQHHQNQTANQRQQ